MAARPRHPHQWLRDVAGMPLACAAKIRGAPGPPICWTPLRTPHPSGTLRPGAIRPIGNVVTVGCMGGQR